MLKALAKNPENRYQSAAQMRTDLIRVHSGEAPEAPKVFTDAERNALLSSSSGGGRRSHADGGWVRRWLVTAVALVALAVVAVVAVNAVGNRSNPVRVPDVHGQQPRDAIAALQNLGFKIRGPIQKPSGTVPLGQVIGTDPGAATALAGGDEVTVNVSSGPEQRTVPTCSNLSVDDCARKLSDAGFEQSKRLPTSSQTVPQNQVIATIPAAGQSAAVSTNVAIEVSTGPEARRVPDVVRQTVEQASTNLRRAGFQIVLTGPVDSTLPAGQVVATDPPADTTLSVQSAITLKVSLGNQFPMPNLLGKTYVQALPILTDLGYAGPLLNGGDVPGPETSRARVVQQDPPSGTGVNRDGTITLTYGS